MPALRLVNQVPEDIARTVEFRVLQGSDQVARIGVHAGAQATVPVIIDGGAVQQWTLYAVVNGITTPTVTTSHPNATITAIADNDDGGFALRVS